MSEEDLADLDMACINKIYDGVSEAVDVYNYLLIKNHFDYTVEDFREIVDEKLARWANRLNGVSDE